MENTIKILTIKISSLVIKNWRDTITKNEKVAERLEGALKKDTIEYGKKLAEKFKEIIKDE